MMSGMTNIRPVTAITCWLMFLCLAYVGLVTFRGNMFWQNYFTTGCGYRKYIDGENALPGDVTKRRAFDFDAPCDILKVITSLYDVTKPLTSSVLEQLRGCLVLLFFRSPRCGTTAIYHLLTKLSRKLNYKSLLGCQVHWQEKWVKYINNLTIARTPTSVSCHHGAMDLVSGSVKSPVMINIIRHPVDHIVSIFKLKKYGNRQETLPDTEASVNEKCNMTLSEYILDQGLTPPCIETRYLGLRFLCGDCDGCDSKPVCLQEAKRNLETLYLAVGTSENIPGFLLVMETLLPQFFHGALKEYVNMSGLYSLFSPDEQRNETMTSEAVEYLNKELADDIELYHYVQQRSFIAIKKVIEYRTNNALEDNTHLRNREMCLVNKTCV